MFIDVNRSGVITTQGQCDIYTHGTNNIQLDICSHSSANVISLRRAAHKIVLFPKGLPIIFVTREARVFGQVS
jgi:hypothetical protein